jgi:hypothetical protein
MPLSALRRLPAVPARTLSRCLQRSLPLAGAALLALPPTAQAGRPLATDDAGTAKHGTSQVELWQDRQPDARDTVLAPACGVAEGIEFGLEYSRPSPRTDITAGAGAAMKWVPSALSWKTPAGEVQAGLKLAAGFIKPRGGSLRQADASALVLLSWAPASTVAAHLNLGPGYDRASGKTAALGHAAVVYAPGERGLLFAETLHNSRSAVFGGATRVVGGRVWIKPEVLGIDLTAARTQGSRQTTWGIGLGWYGIAF